MSEKYKSLGKLTEEQRQKFRKRLEEETEGYFKSCKRTEYKEGWNEETWEKEMEEHPLFAKSINNTKELPPLLEALRQIKYDAGENTPDELARNYKGDGNHLFKKQDYRAAIASYNEGLHQKILSSELKAQLHLNRAAAHFHLNNFGTALEDCIQALQLKSDYVKAMSRALKCCWNLRKLNECDEFCQQILAEASHDEVAVNEAKEYLKKTSFERELQERNRRKRDKEERDLSAKLTELGRALERAGIQLDPPPVESNLLLALTSQYPALKDFGVSLVDDRLVWPVALLYPELKETDFVQRWNEDSTFKQMLDAMYGGIASERRVAGEETVIIYDPNKLQVYYKSKTGGAILVNLNDTLHQIITRKNYVVEGAVPSFWILRRNSEYEKRFLREQGNS